MYSAVSATRYQGGMNSVKISFSWLKTRYRSPSKWPRHHASVPGRDAAQADRIPEVDHLFLSCGC